jgi:protein-S-isoprenylcysteine O-methyltransferase Ste14
VSVFVGEALLFGQISVLLYAIAAWVALFVHWYEEPALARRFGSDDEAYCRAVPGWRPRLSPWHPDDSRNPR